MKKAQLLRHSITTIPQDIVKETVIRTILGVITSLGFDLIAFTLQWGKEQIVKGNIILGLVLIGVYYVKSSLQNTINVWFDDIKMTYEEHYKTVIYQRIIKVLLTDVNQVFIKDEKTNIEEVMNTNRLLSSSKNYINNLWNLKVRMAERILQFLSLGVLFTGMILVSNIEIEHNELFIVIIFVSAIASAFCASMRVKTRRKLRKDKKEVSENVDKYMNDVLNIEPISTKHAERMAMNYVTASKLNFSFDRKMRKIFNKIDLLSSLVNAVATISVIGLKVYEIGISNINLEVVMSIIALVAIYSQITNRIFSIIRIVEDVKSEYDEMAIYENDFAEILKVYDERTIDQFQNVGIISELNLKEFEVRYRAKENAFMLESKKGQSFTPGELILLTGPTGSGKSTYLKAICNKAKFSNFERKFEFDEMGKVLALMHQTDSRLGSDDVLSEITLGSKVDEEMLLKILDGLCLKDSLERKASDIIKYLSQTKYEEFSTGQKQRLVIARLLYNLEENISIIGFDEATNALNDEVCLKCMKFIKEYCKEKNLIIFMATHQVELGKKVADKIVAFEEKKGKTDTFECICSKN